MTEAAASPADRLRLIIDESFTSLSADDELELFLGTSREVFQRDTKNLLPALDCLAYVAARNWRDAKLTPNELVQVPWWVIEVLAYAYDLYIDEAQTGRAPRIGKVFGIEGSGRGKPPRIRAHLKRRRDRNMALNIALRAHHSLSVEKAIAQVAVKTGLEPKSLWDIWVEYKDQASATIAETVTRKTSRIDRSDDDS